MTLSPAAERAAACSLSLEAYLEQFRAAIVRCRVAMLDNLFIHVDAGAVFAAAAAQRGVAVDALTDAQRRAAFLAAALDQARSPLSGAGGAPLSP